MDKIRVSGSLLLASVALFAALEASEGFAPKAMKPVPNDPWTYGYGSTYKLDGSPVQPGELISKLDARKLMEIKVRDEYQPVIHKCAGDIPMTQGEFDSLIDLAYNIGAEKVCRYSIIRKFRAGDYAAGCAAILTVDMLHGKKCSVDNNVNKVSGCRGILNRRQHQYQMCKGVL